MGRIKPPPTFELPFAPAGIRLLNSLLPLGERPYTDNDYRFHGPREYGVGKKLRDHLFKEFTATVIVRNGEYYLSFLDEQSRLVFVLLWGA